VEPHSRSEKTPIKMGLDPTRAAERCLSAAAPTNGTIGLAISPSDRALMSAFENVRFRI
jgi:hypothetical protein